MWNARLRVNKRVSITAQSKKILSDEGTRSQDRLNFKLHIQRMCSTIQLAAFLDDKSTLDAMSRVVYKKG